MAYEYKWVLISFMGLDRRTNEMASEGWEPVSVSPSRDDTTFTVLFRRPKR